MKQIAMATFAIFLAAACSERPRTCNLLIGTYTQNTGSRGLYACEVDVATGKANLSVAFDAIVNPSYLTFSPDGKTVYAVSEAGMSSAVMAFSFDSKTGKLSPLNSVQAQGIDPCYIAATDRHVVTANYTSGSISVFDRDSSGALGAIRQVIRHVGKSVKHRQQDAPHVHQTIFTPDEKFLLANDLGTDRITLYAYAPRESKRILTPVDSLPVKRGSGPRHAALGSGGKVGYLLQELDGTITVFSIRADGKLAVLQETTIARKENQENGGADIHISPDGKFLYATNRGAANDVTCFAIGEDGTLDFVEQLPTGGKGPRNFTITPDGDYIFVGNQYTNSITIFARDKNTGKLTNTGKQIHVAAPVCLLLY
ncbi:MAG: lactonase family protein [Prevotellaceae bacterium]|nr:lactonase family protein [Prevotellaceae bacterium]